MFLFLFVFSIFFQIVSSYGNNDCIKKDDYYHGFYFENCEKPAEIAIKWRKENYLNWHYHGLYRDRASTTLVINDQCTLRYEEDTEHFKWIDENGDEISYSKFPLSTLELHGNGTLITSWDDVVVCGNKSLVNSLDDEWVWTKIRVFDLFDNYDFYDGKEDEGTEIVPPTTSTVIESTTTESIKNDTSIQTVELGRLNLIVALVGVFFGFIAMSCSVALFMFLL
ncbi:hypothetical protein M3Y95_01023800 [Aphelenchoides besseyi]|nr:hypothetical protein M3Y95_01023800 [Aphelenchoides besseyi]